MPSWRRSPTDQRWTSRRPSGVTETYVKRLERLEDLHDPPRGREDLRDAGGREVRVMVQPDDVDDLQAAGRPRYAKQVEEELQYPARSGLVVRKPERSSS